MLKQAAKLGFTQVASSTDAQSHSDVVRLRAPNGANTQTAYELLAGLFSNKAVHFNRRYRLYRTAQDTANAGWQTTVTAKDHHGCSSDQCYGPAAVQWHTALARCAQGLHVGVVDTAVDNKHPTFAGQSVTSTRVAGGRPPRESEGHGTGILALLAGRVGSSTPGLIPDAKFYTTDIFFADANGDATSDSLTLHKALLQMEAWGVQVVNLSLAGPADSLVEKTIQRLSRKGMMFVAAGGNEGPGAGPSYPAAYKEVIAVTAVDRSMRSYRYANRGNYIDLAAPGVDIWTAAPQRKDGLLSGTSLAAPFVTSIVSAVYRALPDKDRQNLLNLIGRIDLGKPGKDNIYGHGLVRAPLNCRPTHRPRQNQDLASVFQNSNN